MPTSLNFLSVITISSVSLWSHVKRVLGKSSVSTSSTYIVCMYSVSTGGSPILQSREGGLIVVDDSINFNRE